MANTAGLQSENTRYLLVSCTSKTCLNHHFTSPV